MNNREPYQPPQEEQSPKTVSAEVDFGVPEIMPLLNRAFKEPVEQLFEEGKKDERGIQHFRLTQEGRDTAGRAFETLENNFGRLSSFQRAEAINQINFTHLGLNDQQNETLRRSLRAQLIVKTARELAPESDPWQTTKHAKEGKKIKAFEALDQALDEATSGWRGVLRKILGPKKAKTALAKWEQFISPERVKDERVKDIENPSRRQALKILGAMGTLVTLALILKGEKGLPIAQATKALAKQPAEPTPIPPTTAPAQEPSKTGPLFPERFSRRHLLESFGQAITPTATPVQKEAAAEKSVRIPQPKVEPQTIKPTGAAEISKQPLVKVTPQVQVKPEREIQTEVRPEIVELLPGSKLTISSPGSAFPDQELEVISQGDFIANQAQRHQLADYQKTAPAGQLYFGSGEGQETILLLDSGHLKGNALPAQVLLESLQPGDKITIANNQGHKTNLEYIGVTNPIPASDELIDKASKAAVDQNFPQAGQDRERGENQLHIIACDTKSWDAKRKLYTNRVVLAFRPARELTPPGPKIAEQREQTPLSSEQLLAEKGETISLQGLKQEVKIPLTDVDNFFAARTLADFQRGALVGSQISPQPEGETSNLLLHSDYYAGQALNGQVVNEAQLNPGDKVRLANLTRTENRQAGAGPIELTYVWQSTPFAREVYDQKTWPTSVTRGILAQAVINLPQDHLLAQTLNEGRNFVGCLTCDPESKKTVDGKTVYPNIILTAFVV